MREAATRGLVSFGVIAYLAVLGLPNQLGGAVVTTLALAMLVLALVFFRDKPGHPQTTRLVATKGLVAGVIAGVLAAAGVVTVAELQRRNVQVIEVFAQLLPEWTEAMTGVTREELTGGASVVGPAVWLGLFIAVGGLLGGVATRLVTSGPVAEERPFWEGPRGRNIRLALPAVLFVVFVLISTDLVTVAGSDENLVGLLVAFAFIAVTLIAFRAARFDRSRLISALTSGGLLALLPLFTDQFQDAVLGKVAIFFVVGIGLNIVVGYAGLLDLGYIGFFAVGAYAFGLLSSPESYVVVSLDAFGGIRFWTGLPIAIGFGIIMGLFIGLPVLRLRGDYLAIVTLGFGQIVRLLLLNLREVTGGPGGVLDVPAPTILGVDFGDPQRILYLALVAAGLAAFVSLRLRDSRLGRAWVAMREDQDVAQAMGVNVVAAKLFAFATGAAFAGGAGALYAAQQVNIFPDNFRLEVSIAILSAVIIGGLGSVGGVVLGSIALIGLPELLRGVDEFRIVAFGALLVIMMIVRPEGLLPEARRSFELHEADRDQDAWLRAADAAESQEAEDAAEDRRS